MNVALYMWAGCFVWESPEKQKPDVLLVVLDTVRADHLSTYGYHRQTSPVLSSLAEQGVLFADVTAPSSWTWPSHASLFTGVLPWEHGAHRAASGAQLDDSDWFLSSMNSDLPTLAESFSNAGYDTYAFATNMLLKEELGLMRGFAHVQAIDDEEATMEAARALLSKPHDAPMFIFVNLMTAHAPYLVTESVPYSAEHKSDFMKETAPSDWRTPYLFDGYAGIHFPIFLDDGKNGEMHIRSGSLTIPEQDKQAVVDLYDGELLRLNYMLGALLRAWGERSGIVAVTSDHGEYLFEHNRVGHGVELHPPVLSIPLVLAYPGILSPQIISKPVSLIRLGPTLLRLAGIQSKGGLAASNDIFTVDDKILEAGVWGFSDWASGVDMKYSLRRRWYRQGNLGGWVDEQGMQWVCVLDKDPMCEHNVASLESVWAKKIAQRAISGFSKEQPSTFDKSQEKKRLEILRLLGYVED